MKTIVIFMFFLKFNSLLSQCIQFTYVAAGDRTARNICPQPLISPNDTKVEATNMISLYEISDDEIKVFPNPTSGVFEIQAPSLSNETTFTITDVLGRTLSRNNLSFGKINISGWPGGRYFVRVVDGKRYKVVTIVKE